MWARKITIIMRDVPEVWKKFEAWKGTRFLFGGWLVDCVPMKTSDGRHVVGWRFNRCKPWSYRIAKKAFKDKATVLKGWW